MFKIEADANGQYDLKVFNVDNLDFENLRYTLDRYLNKFTGIRNELEVYCDFFVTTATVYIFHKKANCIEVFEGKKIFPDDNYDEVHELLLSIGDIRLINKIYELNKVKLNEVIL